MDATIRTLGNQNAVRAPTDAYSAIRQAATETGVDFDYLYRTAKRESSLNASAKAQTSSAVGLFQFTSDTWLRMVERYGAKYGLQDEANAVSIQGRKVVADADRKADILSLREDPVLSARMAGELANENKRILKAGIGREPTERELYAAHFLGPAGATKLINAARETPGQDAAALFPTEANANRNIFTNAAGEARSVSLVYARLTGQAVSDADGGPEYARRSDSPSAPNTAFADRTPPPAEPTASAPAFFASSAPAPADPASPGMGFLTQQIHEARRASNLLAALLELQTEPPGDA